MGGWWVEVDGFVLPKPISGHPALELCNTRSGWGEPDDPRQEYLRSYGHLVVAARHAGVLDPARAALLLARSDRGTPAVRRELDRARRLRRDAHDLLAGGGTAAALERVGAAVLRARSGQVLERGPNGTRWAWTGTPALSEPLDALLVQVGELLVSPQSARVRTCPGHGCGWLFLDTSGRRRWCQMSVCGNRAKQARLRAT